MTPSQQCKAAGLDSLAELSRWTNTSVNTLVNWHRNKPILFAVVIEGAAAMKARQNMQDVNAQLDAMHKQWQSDFEAVFGKRGERTSCSAWDARFSVWKICAAVYHHSER